MVVGSTSAWINGVNFLKSSDIPSGIITMWSGTTTNIPFGWLLCNGLNGTPDLRDRFIVGAGNGYNVGTTGGEAAHTLSITELPSHNHTASTSVSLNNLSAASAGGHTHTVSKSGSVNSSGLHINAGKKLQGSGSSALNVSSDANASNALILWGNSIFGGAFNYNDAYEYVPVVGSIWDSISISVNGAGEHTHSLTGSASGSTNIGNTGSSYAHENRPPYYALCFIMKS